MVAPIVGPIVTEIGGEGDDDKTYYSLQKKYRQAVPIDQPLPYQRDVGRVEVMTGPLGGGARSVGTQSHQATGYDFVDLTGKSYDKLKSDISDRAQLSVGLIEGRQSLAMIASRAGQLFQFGRRLSRLDLAGAAKALRLSAVPKGASVKKSFASNWLEFYFGWSPLIGDIGSAVNVLQSPLKNQFCKGRAKAGPDPTVDLQVPQDLSRPSAQNDWTRWVSFDRLTVTKRAMSQGVNVAVSNPNLWLANQLGFVNPATVAWELIPFSFVVDWFVNVEQFLSSGTDFLGLTLEDAWNTKYVTMTRHYRLYREWRWIQSIDWSTWPARVTYSYSTDLSERIVHGYHVVRSTGLASPTLYVRPWKLWKWKRALTAVSLLTQQLSRR